MIFSPSDSIRRTITQGDFLSLDRSHWMMKDLVGWWPLQEGAGLNAYDVSGRGSHCSGIALEGDEWSVQEGLHGIGLDSGEGFTLGAEFSSLKTASAFSLSVWVYVTDTSPTNGDYVVLNQGGASSSNLQLGYFTGTGGNFRLAVSTTSGRGTADIAKANWSTLEWFHIVCTYDGSTLSIYKNATLEGTDTTGLGGNLTLGTGDFYIGTRSDGYVFREGDLRDCRVWVDRVLTPSEIRELYLNPWAPIRQTILIPEIAAAGGGDTYPASLIRLTSL